MAGEKIFLTEETEIRYALAVCYPALIEEVEKYVRYEPDNPTFIRNTLDAREMYDMAFGLLWLILTALGIPTAIAAVGPFSFLAFLLRFEPLGGQLRDQHRALRAGQCASCQLILLSLISLASFVNRYSKSKN